MLLTLRQWGAAIALDLVGWMHTPPELDALNEWSYYTYVTDSITGVRFGLHCDPQVCSFEDDSKSDKVYPDKHKLVFGTSWPSLFDPITQKGPVASWAHAQPYDKKFRAAVTPNRSAAKVVASIRKRFLDPYYNEWLVQDKHLKSTFAEHREMLAIANGFAHIFGDDDYPDDWYLRDAIKTHGFEFSRYLGKVKVDVQVDLETAKQIAMLVAGKAYIVPIGQLFDPDKF